MIEISWKLIKFSDTNSLQKSGLVSDNQQSTIYAKRQLIQLLIRIQIFIRHEHPFI